MLAAGRLFAKLLVLAITPTSLFFFSALGYGKQVESKSQQGCKAFVDQIAIEIKAAQIPPFRVPGTDATLIRAMLRAGYCDKAYQRMANNPRNFLDPYCFAMALAGRDEELPKKINRFRNMASVNRELREYEVPFERYCQTPTLHGLAMRGALNGNLKDAATECLALKETGRSKAAFEKTVRLVAKTVLFEQGASSCIKFLEEVAGANREEFNKLLRAMLNSVSKKDQVDCLMKLSPKHSARFAHEAYLFFPGTYVPIEEKRRLAEFAFEQLGEFTEKEAMSIKLRLVQAEVLSEKQHAEIGEECLSWLCQPKKGSRADVRALSSWLIQTGQLDRLKEVKKASNPKDLFFQASLIVDPLTAARNLGDWESAAKLGAMLPKPNELSKPFLNEATANLLIETGQSELATKWIAELKVGPKREKLEEKCEFYSALENDDFTFGKVAAAKLADISGSSDRKGASSVRKQLGTDFLAEIALRAGPKPALKCARELIGTSKYAPNAVEICVEALVQRKEYAAALKIVKAATPQEVAEAKFNQRPFILTPSQFPPEMVGKLYSALPGNYQVLQRRINIAVANKEKKEALKLLRTSFLDHGKTSEGRAFAKALWHDEFIKVAKRVGSEKAKDGTYIGNLVSTLAGDMAYDLTLESTISPKQTIVFVQRHVSDPRRRIQIYLVLCNEYADYIR